MLPLAWFLAAVLAACLACLVSAGAAARGRGPGGAVWLKRLIAAYAAAVTLLLGSVVHHFIGWEGHGSPQVPKQLQRRIEHTGYYFAPERELTLRGKSAAAPARGDAAPGTAYDSELIRQLLPNESDGAAGESSPEQAEGHGVAVAPDEGFVHGSLKPGESLTLKPIWEGGRAAQWSLRYRVDSRPLRLNSVEQGKEVSRCVNVPEGRWLNPGDTIFLTLERGDLTHFVSVTWDLIPKYWGPFADKTDAYHLAHGTVGGESGPGLLMSERVLTDGAALGDMVRRGKKEFRERVGSIDDEWWGVLGGIALVREERGRKDSRIGVLVAEELFRHPGLTISRRHARGLSELWAADAAEKTALVPTATTVAYGFRGQRASFELKLTGEAFDDDIWGQVARVKFVQPKAWPLPPALGEEDFIITSSNDYIPLDGYFLDIGNSRHSFYAKARLDHSLDGLSVNDGRNVVPAEKPSGGRAAAGGEARHFGLGTDASLGDYEQGVLIALTATRAGGRVAGMLTGTFGAPYIGPLATAFLVCNLACFLLVAGAWPRDRPRLLLAWALIWGATLTILSVRLVLAYRVSLVPPLDASLSEIAGIFHKGVDFALAGLALFALLSLTLYFSPRKTPRPSRSGWLGRLLTRLWALHRHRRFTPAAVALWAALVIGYTLAGRFFGTNQSLGVRISIVNHLLIVGGLALLAGRVLGHPEPWLRLLAAANVLLALVLQIVVVRDAGAVIYAYSLLLCVGLLWGWRRPGRTLWDRAAALVARRRRLRRCLFLVPVRARRRLEATCKGLLRLAPLGVPLAAVAALFLVPYMIEAGWGREVVQPHLPETTFYRFVSFTDSEDVILTTKSGDEDADMSKLLDNSQQDWQMLLYASHGASAPTGYGRAPLSKIGMTYATSVSDCAFSTYLLAEHGRWAALLLLLFYVLIAAACVLAGWHLDEQTRHRGLPLVAVGAFFACNALYMAGANTGFTVFTGQNLPLLGLNSGGDLLQGLVLAWLAGWLLSGTAREGAPVTLLRRHPGLLSMGVILFALLCFWLVAVGWQMKKVGEKEVYREDHNFKPETLDRIEENLPPERAGPYGQRTTPLVLKGTVLERTSSGQLMEIEEQYVRQFMGRVDKFNPNGGLYYLEQPRGEGGETRVRVNRRYFSARSPFSQQRLWRGQIVAGGESEPTIYKLNTRLKISLQRGGHAGSVDLEESRPLLTNSSVSLRRLDDNFCELKREGNTLRLDPHLERQWDVYVDGKKLAGPADLDPLSIIVVERREDRYRRNLIYLGMTRPVLAYVRWRNGEQRRMFPEGGFPLAHLLGKAADRAAEMESELPEADRRLGDELALGLNARLHQSLQQRVAAYAGAHANYSPFSPRPNRLAATVMDAFSGQVLALPSWPALDPGRPDYETQIDKVPEPTRSRFEDNHNLGAHVVGSTLKPVILATMATELRAGGYDLTGMRIVNREDPQAVAAVEEGETYEHLHTRVNGIKIETWDCNSTERDSDMADFMVHSRDFPVGVLGMLGMLTDARELGRVRVPNAAAPDILYDGSGYALDMTRAAENATAFTIQDQLDGRNPTMRAPEVVNRTILFRGLSSLFDYVSQGTREARLQRACESFFPTLCNRRLRLDGNDYLDNVTAARLDMGGGDYQDIRHGLISCLLGGGGECGFNNVMMAEAGARLATGRRVFARLEDSPSRPEAEPLPGPLGDGGWRVSHIITPMQRVGEVGTAKDLRGLVGVPAQYKAIYKTGTIAEGIEGRESEALMFVVGRWENGGFVAGQTLAGFIYMERSKARNARGKQLPDGKMKKFEFAAPILNDLLEHLRKG